MIFSRRQFLAAAAASVLPATDEAFLEDLSHRAFLFFWEQAAAKTGFPAASASMASSATAFSALKASTATSFSGSSRYSSFF